MPENETERAYGGLRGSTAARESVALFQLSDIGVVGGFPFGWIESGVATFAVQGAVQGREQ